VSIFTKITQNTVRLHTQVSNEMEDASLPSYDPKGDANETKIKIICLGDSAVGKSK